MSVHKHAEFERNRLPDSFFALSNGGSMGNATRFTTTVAAAFLAVAGALTVGSAGAAQANCSATPDPATGVACQSWIDTAQADGSTLIDLTVTTPAIFHAAGSGTPSVDPVQIPIGVKVYLPAGYQGTRAPAYPVLYLLHGGGGGYQDWADSSKGDIVNTVRGSAFTGIVVMPESGLAGWYSDWAGRTDGYFAPAWETFHISQLITWVDAHFNTVSNRSGRAIAGLSMGGFGALKYAGAHPDLFSAVGSFSGGTDITNSAAQSTISDSMWQAGAATGRTGLLDGKFRVNKYNPDGSLVTDQAQQASYRMATLFGAKSGWPAINPIDLVASDAYQAYGTRFGLYVGGCGTLSPDTTVTTSTGRTNSAGCAYSDPISVDGEPKLALMNRDFDAALSAAGVNHRYCTGTGNHSWPYWRSDLRNFLQYAYGPTPDTGDCNNA
jgi:S-formylglutathione hydrolase FrmB